MSSERRRGRSSRRRAGAGPPPRADGCDWIQERSYGGVVLRGELAAGTAEIVVIVPRGKHLLALPKGGGEDGERPEETALREVREEAGVTARVRADLGVVTYHYRRRGGRRVRKSVHFYLCDYLEGTPDDHDHEVTEARWIPLEEARSALGYPGERRMAETAVGVLRGG